MSNSPARVWREGRAKKGPFEFYPDNKPGRLPKRPKRSPRVGIPKGLEVHQGTAWMPTGELLYPPPASEDVQPRSKWSKLGLAGFAAANPDPENPQALPRLYVRRVRAPLRRWVDALEELAWNNWPHTGALVARIALCGARPTPPSSLEVSTTTTLRR